MADAPTIPASAPGVRRGEAERLRIAITRLARLLRQQDQGELGATVTAALGTVARFGPITLGDLAAREHLAPPTVTKLAEKMVTRGLVKRTADASDRRISRLALTRAGERHLDDSRHRRAEWLMARLLELSPAEADRLAAATDVLERLIELPDGHVTGQRS